jgi:hypothetical protein
VIDRPYRILRSRIAVVFGFLIFATAAYAESVVPYRVRLPKAKHYEAAAIGEDCAIYRKMKQKAQGLIREAKATGAKYAEMLVHSRLALESCAKQHGIEDIDEDRDDILVAELCAPFYQDWLRPASRLELLEADIKAAVEMEEVMQSRLQNFCGHIESDSSDDLSKG